jgi:hypothetical protein
MRKLFYLTTALLLVNTFAFGQDTLRKKKFYIGGFASPDISYRALFPLINGNTAIGNFIKHERDSMEIPRFAYTFGLDFLYQFNKRIALSWGLQYSLKGYQTKTEKWTFGSSLNQGGFVSTAQIPVSGHLAYNYNYIDIPIRADIYLGKGKITTFITAGITTNILLYEKNISYITYADGHQGTQSNVNSAGYNLVNLQAQLGAGVDIALKKSRLRILPIARTSFLSDYNTAPIHEYLWSVGLGVSYLFGI